MPETPVAPSTTHASEELLLLREIAQHLKHLDSRDRMRTMWGIAKGAVLGLISVVLLGGVAYAYQHMTDFIKAIGTSVATQSMEASKQGSKNMMRQIQDYLKR